MTTYRDLAVSLAKCATASADTSGLEREIDEAVYALSGLTPEETKIVEPASAKA